jgi:hypothetical protein
MMITRSVYRRRTFDPGPVSPRPEGTEGWWVVAGMATQPARLATLAGAVMSIARQVDELHVYLNALDEPPAGLPRATNIRYHCGADLGAAAKLGYQAGADVYLSVDDDLIYAGDYVARHLAAQIRYTDTITCVHGSVLRPDYEGYTSSRRVLSGYRGLSMDAPVHVIGTGTAAWKPREIHIPVSAATRPVQIDVPVSIYARSRGMRTVCIAHPACTMVDTHGADQSVAICRMTQRDSSAIDADVMASGLHLEAP